MLIYRVSKFLTNNIQKNIQTHKEQIEKMKTEDPLICSTAGLQSRNGLNYIYN